MNDEGTGAVINICSDALSVASQLGRLDLVTIILAVVSILIVFSGVVAYFEVRHTAKKSAKEAAEEIAGATAKVVANQYMEKQVPLILQEYQSVAASMANVNTVNGIADVQKNYEIKNDV